MPRLRVGLLLDSLVQPRWIRRVLESLRSSDHAVIALAAVGDAHQNPPRGLAAMGRDPKRSLYRLYSALDHRLFHQAGDALEPVPVGDLLEGVETLSVLLRHEGNADRLADDDLQVLRERDLDVALHLGPCRPANSTLNIAKFGVWSYRLADPRAWGGAVAGFWEVMRGSAVTHSALAVLGPEPAGDRVIAESTASTDYLSVRRNRSNFLWTASGFVERKLRGLRERGPSSLREDDLPSPVDVEQSPVPPNNIEMLRLALGLAGRWTRERLEGAMAFKQWCLAYTLSPHRQGRQSFRYLIPPRDRFWADPFPVARGGHYYIFIEEVPYRTRKGHISVIEMDRGGSWSMPMRVFERDFHVSYPFLFEWEGRLHMIPETFDNGTVELYACTSFPTQWSLRKVLLSGVRAVDATLAPIGDRWWMFLAQATGGALPWEELHIYYATSPLGPWRAHRRNPVKSDVRWSRPAGRLFERGGILYRPAQDCSGRYGRAVSVNRIDRIDREDYRETQVARIDPDWDASVVATHTLNSAGEMTILDCLRRRGPGTSVGAGTTVEIPAFS